MPALAGSVTVFTNVRVFDGKATTLSPPTTVTVRGNSIAAIGEAPVDLPADARVIDGAGRTLMPGLIDAHTHMIYTLPSQSRILTRDLGYLNVVATRAAHEMLLRGFTSVRDTGGPVFGLKQAIDEGVVSGPRIWPSGLSISQTGGHGDFRMPNEVAADDHGHAEMLGAVADSPEEVQQEVRRQLALGATQIKLMAGGGVASPFDPLDVTQYSPAELRAAVEAAANWDTYVTVHAYTPGAIRQAVEAGVKSVEHGHLIDEPTAQLMAAKGTWIVLQAFFDDEDAVPFPAGSASRAKQLEMIKGTDNAYGLVKKHRLKLAWGSDTLFDPKLASRQGGQLAKLATWFTPGEVLRIATGQNAELLAMSGKRNPYPGRIGVVEAGALADLILVDGDPTRDLALITTPETSFLVIMKDGRIVKDITGNGLPVR
ncbi:metal-dependent hydrolase family protein [Erythrobacter oryzae]|uniref:metal-dependent hydrolase family protein n=1 Tax=Erythrobacter oryzae TaxID=3019556 RepID=UPI002555FAFE|nr:amidohydrolase family protein [Erythrobacter sp. COR-2]